MSRSFEVAVGEGTVYEHAVCTVHDYMSMLCALCVSETLLTGDMVEDLRYPCVRTRKNIQL